MGTNDVLDAINRLLLAAYPDRRVDINYAPVEFKRPCFLLELVDVKLERLSRYIVKRIERYSITCFEGVDAYNNTDRAALMETLDKVLWLFADGYIVVGDRAVNVVACAAGCDFADAYVDITIEYTVDLGRVDYEPIGEVEIRRVK